MGKPGKGIENRLFFFLPSVIVLFVWGVYMVFAERLYLFAQHWELSLTMVFGSLVAGATSEGGGAVAFPVFTKLLHIPPDVARVFGMAIQMIGMGTAAVVIFKYRIRVVGSALVYSSLGGLVGIWLGTMYVAPNMLPAYFKIAFTVLTLAFAVVLIYENQNLRFTRSEVVRNLRWNHYLLMAITGVLGGVFTAIVGTGIDFFTFAILVLFFNISEKVATPTSVVLMAINSTAGFVLHAFYLDNFIGKAVADYWLVCVPIVIFGAPIGAIICSRISRTAIIRFLLFLIFVEVVTTLWLVKFDSFARVATPILFVTLIVFFLALNWLRIRRLTRVEASREGKSG